MQQLELILRTSGYVALAALIATVVDMHDLSKLDRAWPAADVGDGLEYALGQLSELAAVSEELGRPALAILLRMPAALVEARLQMQDLRDEA